MLQKPPTVPSSHAAQLTVKSSTAETYTQWTDDNNKHVS